MYGQRNGQGVYQWPDGSKFEGNFEDGGNKYGIGKFTRADGVVDDRTVWEQGEKVKL